MSQILNNIIVAGACKGVGHSATKSILSKGNFHILMITGSDYHATKQEWQALKEEFPKQKEKLFFHTLDVENITSINLFVNYLKKYWGAFHTLINFEEYYQPRIHLSESTDISASRVVKTFSKNLFSNIYLNSRMIQGGVISSRILSLSSSQTKLSFTNDIHNKLIRDSKSLLHINNIYIKYLNSIETNAEWEYSESQEYNAFIPSKICMNLYYETMAICLPSVQFSTFTLEKEFEQDDSFLTSMVETTADLRLTGKLLSNKGPIEWK